MRRADRVIAARHHHAIPVLDRHGLVDRPVEPDRLIGVPVGEVGKERGDDLEQVKLHGPPKEIEAGREYPFIVVSPQVDEGEWWSPSTIIWILNELKAKMNIDEDRVYLTGLSMGGYGSWDTAIRHPNLWAALVPVCGKGDPTTAERIKHIPTWIFHGAKDSVVPFRHSQDMFEGWY